MKLRQHGLSSAFRRVCAASCRWQDGRSRNAWLVAAFVGAGCQEDLEPVIGERIYDGAEFEVWATDGRRPCAGTFEYMEGWLDAFRAYTGPLPTQKRHRFYWLTEEEFDELGICPDGTAGCVVQGRSIYARNLPMQHEIVHVELGVQTNSFIAEGFAEVYGGNESRWRDESADVRALISLERLPTRNYGTAGHFVRYVVEKYGFQLAYRWMRATELGDDYPLVRDAFAATIGGDLDRVVEEFETDVPNCSEGWRIPIYECSLPPEPWNGGTWSWTAELGCDADAAVGPDIGTIRMVKALEIPAGHYVVNVVDDSDEPSTVAITRCGIRCGDALADAWVFYPQVPVRWTFAAGAYWVQVQRPDAGGGVVSVELERINE